MKKLVKADPSDAGAWNSLAAAYLHLNEAGKAEAASAEAIKAEPKNAEYWGTYGFALAAAEKDDNARSAAVKASELDPKLAVPYYVQALVSFRLVITQSRSA
ncbi:MAG: hypothetical protein UZ17_ACD001001337 [Acidobacteria bacterium OLB17]|nr:MAG: hypothetical protein UZ17_ACD001001337 [Acidobacteria bacterium OLB17]